MVSEHNVNTLLKIINGTLKDSDYYDSEELLRLIELHNIPGRIIQCINKYKYHSYFTREFILRIEILYKEFSYAVENNIDAVCEILEEYDRNENKLPVVIKGFSNYVLSNKKWVIRRGDIDIVPPEVDEFVNILLSKQYIQTKIPFMHEAGEYSKDNIEFDVHLFFPVYRYDEKASSMQDIRNCIINMPFEKISYEMLSANSYESKQRKGLYVADANMMIIIICSHAFMNYTNIWSISHREKSYIKLGELWDIFDLVKHETYSNEKLQAYIEKYKAEDCVLWTCSVMTELFGYNPLPYSAIEFDRFSERFPKCLWWEFWEHIPTPKTQMLSDDWYDIRYVMKYTGNSIVEKNKWKNINDIENKYLIGKINILFMVKEDRLIIKKPDGILCKDCQYRVDFGSSAVELGVRDNTLRIGDSSSKVEVMVSKFELSIELISNMFIFGYRDTDDGINEVLVSVLVKEA